ncbi:MAG: YceH family protein [Deltaproteobacteria bacterium]|nr:YceH family protein [Deltaproteobacteria bacterium]
METPFLTLTAVEVRILGSLVEKELTTPDYYPLSLNALTNACNQKTNRDPVLTLEEGEVVRGLDRLRKAGLVAVYDAEGGRVPKYLHNLGGKLLLKDPEVAVLAELMLRGPQTVGELRGRAERMHPFGDLASVESTLEGLIAREAPLVSRLQRQPGRKEHRYAQLLSGPVAVEASGSPNPASQPESDEDARIRALEGQVESLRAELDALRREFLAFRAQLE